ncbi:DUF397 domain-containing protein [Kitasatospora sp. NPDC006697]|uniref:DUF397 domain-containing protein n=1 Tax=Kitasatospora sp. NPDC006697 TaxID=3364020 RepID=UPI00367730BB
MPDLSAIEWRKSTYSDAQRDCVEVALAPCTVPVRDSKDPAGPALVFPPSAWSTFIDGIKSDAALRP